MEPLRKSDCQTQKEDNHPQDKNCGRREFLKGAARITALGGAAMLAGCGTEAFGSSEALKLRFKEFFKKNYRLMTPQEKEETVQRLERLAKIKHGVDVQMSTRKPIEGGLFGYAFNVTRCEGYMECVAACVKENNLDRKSNTQYIRIFEMEHGEMTPEVGDGKYFHEVPVADHFYMGVQCFH
jgi:molybdopterin-containing oxidoreductase family iron-sulfur binding subunit